MFVRRCPCPLGGTTHTWPGGPGFVWRLQTDDGNATAIRAFDDERGPTAFAFNFRTTFLSPVQLGGQPSSQRVQRAVPVAEVTTTRTHETLRLEADLGPRAETRPQL